MECTADNNVNIYNLSCGKSVPDWLTDRKRRLLQKKNVDIRRRIELIQDFEMPGVSTGIKMTRDGNYIFATGIYKPRIRCYDVNNLSMKFDRCFDAEAVQFEILNDDYKKLALLQCDRTIELHVQYGTYYKLRIPKCGRDMKYHRASCDLLTCGSGSDIYRLNLEQGRFLYPYHTDASSVNKLAIHEYYDIIVCGTMEGKVEGWDPRQRERISILDCALSLPDHAVVDGFPSITALSFKGDLTMGVGTFTGQVMLYDIRANKPFIVKNHGVGLPIKNIEFIGNEGLVASLDQTAVKFWKQNTAEMYTTVTAPAHLNDLCIVPNSGLFFMANEDQKILSYFIPSIGPAPKWCCFLDNITEELEESKQDAVVYDDYKFVTKRELDQLHLDHLIGTKALRAYMHGYFMDIRLYNKARSIIQPEAFSEFKKKMVQSKIEKERNTKQILLKRLPTINREYAEKLVEKKTNDKKQAETPFEDDRFKDLFENPDFEIKETDEEYVRIKATVEKSNKTKVTIVQESQSLDFYEDDVQMQNSSESESESNEESEESEEEVLIERKKKQKGMLQPVDSDKFSLLKKQEEDEDLTVPIEERLKKTHASFKETDTTLGNKVVTWTTKMEKQSKREKERKAHMKEREKYRRPAKYLRK